MRALSRDGSQFYEMVEVVFTVSRVRIIAHDPQLLRLEYFWHIFWYWIDLRNKSAEHMEEFTIDRWRSGR